MRILYIIHFFPPEVNGGATRAYELASMWAGLGHEVIVSTGFPNHPIGKIFDGYKLKAVQKERLNGFTLRRAFIYPTPNEGYIKRILNHLSLTISSVLANAGMKNKPDVIIASSPPLFMGLSGVALSKALNVPFIFEARDLWPQQAIDLGMLRNQKVIALAEKMEMFIYNQSAAIVAVTHGIRRILVNKGISSKRVTTITNGVDIDYFRPSERDNWVRKKYVLNGKFVVSHIGTMGLSQGLSVVIDAAEFFFHNNPEIHFLMVGEGADKNNLIRSKQEKGLNNVTFVDGQPREKVPDFYAASDACLVLLKDKPLFRSASPTKMFEIMACAAPIILGIQGEAQSIIEQSRSGVCIEPESADLLIQAIQSLMKQPALRSELGLNGREYVCEHYNREKLARDYLAMLESLLACH